MSKLFYMFDWDGTLSDDSKRRHYVEQSPKDYDSYHAELFTDEVNVPLVKVMRSLIYSGHRVEIWTARSFNSGRPVVDCEGRLRFVTVVASQKWVEEKLWPALNVQPYNRPVIRMRDGNDPRDLSAALLKAEWAWIFGKPDMVFDDRQVTVDHWRSLGIPCVQVRN